MRPIFVALIVAVGFGIFGASGASAAPAYGSALAKAVDQESQVILTSGGCGRGWHRGPRGKCRRN